MVYLISVRCSAKQSFRVTRRALLPELLVPPHYPQVPPTTQPLPCGPHSRSPQPGCHPDPENHLMAGSQRLPMGECSGSSEPLGTAGIRPPEPVPALGPCVFLRPLAGRGHVPPRLTRRHSPPTLTPCRAMAVGSLARAPTCSCAWQCSGEP